MFRRLTIIVFAMLISVPAMAADLSGAWSLRSGNTTLYRFEISQTKQGWSAVWDLPTQFRSNGETFTNVAGPVVHRSSSKAIIDGNGADFTFDDPLPGHTPDVVHIEAIDATHASVQYPGFGAEPFPLVREAANAPIGSWDPQKTYAVPLDRSTNAELTAIFDADQTARHNYKPGQSLQDGDRPRRARTAELIAQGALHSGDDFLHAAFVYQHGDTPDDYLKAHILATIAAARGNPDGVWIAAATLDRYLQSINHPQIFGTQFRSGKDIKVTQEPYDRTLISDSLRVAMKVSPVAQQAEQLKQMGGDAPTAKP